MRILNTITDKKIDNITIYLTNSEAQELLDSLEAIISEPKHHSHIPSEDFMKEITVCIYDPNNLSGFNERSKKLILEDY
jgi:hypothetical protein